IQRDTAPQALLGEKARLMQRQLVEISGRQMHSTILRLQGGGSRVSGVKATRACFSFSLHPTPYTRLIQYFLFQKSNPNHSSELSNSKRRATSGSSAARSRPSARNENPLSSRAESPARRSPLIHAGRPSDVWARS